MRIVLRNAYGQKEKSASSGLTDYRVNETSSADSTKLRSYGYKNNAQQYKLRIEVKRNKSVPRQRKTT